MFSTIHFFRQIKRSKRNIVLLILGDVSYLTENAIFIFSREVFLSDSWLQKIHSYLVIFISLLQMFQGAGLIQSRGEGGMTDMGVVVVLREGHWVSIYAKFYIRRVVCDGIFDASNNSLWQPQPGSYQGQLFLIFITLKGWFVLFIHFCQSHLQKFLLFDLQRRYIRGNQNGILHVEYHS